MFIDFRKAFLLYLFLKIFLNDNVNLINLPGVPLLTLEMVCNLCFFAYFYTLKRKLIKSSESFPLKISIIIVITSILISTIFSTVGFSTSISRAIKIIVNDYLIVFLIWYVIQSIDDIRFLLKGLIVTFLLLTVYGVFEKMTGENPVADYTYGLNSDAKVIDFSYNEGRLGMGRVRSFITHAIGFGGYLASFIYFFAIFSFKYKNIFKISKSSLLIIVGLGLSVLIFTNSRSPIVFLALLGLPFINFKKVQTYRLVLVSFFLLIACYPIIEPYTANFISLFTSDGTSTDVGGSSMSLRFMQYVSAFIVTKNNLLIGNGIKSIESIMEMYDTDLAGLESIWLGIFIERGVVGIVCFTLPFIALFMKSKGENKIVIRAFVIGWLAFNTITSAPGFGLSFFFTVVIIFYKANMYLENNVNIKVLDTSYD